MFIKACHTLSKKLKLNFISAMWNEAGMCACNVTAMVKLCGKVARHREMARTHLEPPRWRHRTVQVLRQGRKREWGPFGRLWTGRLPNRKLKRQTMFRTRPRSEAGIWSNCHPIFSISTTLTSSAFPMFFFVHWHLITCNLKKLFWSTQLMTDWSVAEHLMSKMNSDSEFQNYLWYFLNWRNVKAVHLNQWHIGKLQFWKVFQCQSLTEGHSNTSTTPPI